MNSSGIKRGLAGSAVAALAVTGLPFLASTASAAAGDTITVVSAGPALNGGTEGAVLVLRVKDGTVDPADLALTSTTSSDVDSQNTADQTVAIDHSYDDIVDDPSDAKFDIITTHVDVTTSNTGDTAAFRVIDNDGTEALKLEASEARVNASVSTAGPVATIDVAPASQSVAAGQKSGDYTVTLKDSAGRTTQLDSGKQIAITTDDAVNVSTDESGQVISADEIATGTDTFAATTTGAASLSSHTITLTANGPAVVGKATLVVTAAADLQADEVDIVTGADSWDGFGGGAFGGTTKVRVDQTSIRIDFKSDDVADRNSTVTLTVNGDRATTGGATDVTFGGKKSTTVTTKLDANGVGSLTITPDALSIQENDQIWLTGSFAEKLKFERATATTITATQDPYFGKLKGSVDVTATVEDQFGDPITTGFLGAQRVAGPNSPDTQQAKAVGSDGSATFTFTDAKATNGDVDTVGFGYVPDQFTPPADAFPLGSTDIKWTTDGMGADFVTSIGSDSTEAPTYDPAKHSVAPLADAEDDGAGDSLELNVDNGEPGAKVTVSVDHGGLILEPGETDLSEASSSITATLDASGDLVSVTPGTFRLVGTESGTPTVTVSAAGRTETAKYTVAAETDPTTARNVTVSGPATVPSGTSQLTYTAVITDAFGNPVVGFPRSAVGTDLLNIQVSGPAQFKDGDTQSDANGAIKLNVAVQPGAQGDVTIQVKGVNSVFFLGGVDQFGAAADRLTAQSTSDDAKGLPVSSDTATATTTVEAPVVVQEPINLSLSGKSKGKKDVVKANADDNAAGLTAVLLKNGKKVKSHALNASGDWTFTVKDKNGNKKTKYTVKVAATDATKAGKRSIKLK